MPLFRIDATNLHWMDDPINDPDDLCLHGDAVTYIGDRKLEYDECTVSATALYLLKTLTEDHVIDQDNQMLPCCGHFLMANDDMTEVTIVGCPNGVDWSVIHFDDSVRLILEDGYEVSVPIARYSEEVCRFADLIEKYYLDCPPKTEPQDEFDRNGYEAFWKEWHHRYNESVIRQSLSTGREIELQHNGLHYFISRHSMTQWYLFCEETKEEQIFPTANQLFQNAHFNGKLLLDSLSELTIDCIF